MLGNLVNVDWKTETIEKDREEIIGSEWVDSEESAILVRVPEATTWQECRGDDSYFPVSVDELPQ